MAPVTAGVLKINPAADGQTDAGPVMDAGVAGAPSNDKVRAVLAPQALLATTDNVPLTNPEGTIMLTEVPVLVPEKVHPAGAVQA